MKSPTSNRRHKIDKIIDWLFLTEPLPEDDPRYVALKSLVEEGGPLSQNEQNIASLALGNYVSNRKTEKLRRKSTVENRVLYGVVFGMMIWMGATTSEIDKANKSAAANAQVARELTQDLQSVVKRNRGLIDRLNEVARQAHNRGARTDLRQCQDIEALKREIRTVLRQANRPKDAARFDADSCKKLPTQKLPTP